VRGTPGFAGEESGGASFLRRWLDLGDGQVGADRRPVGGGDHGADRHEPRRRLWPHRPRLGQVLVWANRCARHGCGADAAEGTHA